jgi:predicted DNA-binding transcriptional regulator YafY
MANPNVTDSNAVARVLAILQQHMSAPSTIGELAQLHNVESRTIRRDLRAIRKAGFPLEFREGQYNRQHWRVVRSRMARGITSLRASK